MMTTGAIIGQERSNGQVKVLTVCEVLENKTRYADTGIGVIGRMERSVSLTDHYEFLSQDRCEHPVITPGHVWSDKIQIWAAWEAGMPKPPSDRPEFDRSVVAPKLLMVRNSTKLGFHREPRFKRYGHSIVDIHTVEVLNEWAIVYGRILRVPDLNEDCGAGGCGGNNVPLVIIAEPYNIRALREDATYLPEDKWPRSPTAEMWASLRQQCFMYNRDGLRRRECPGSHDVCAGSTRMGKQRKNQEESKMRCRTCGASFESHIADLPVKISDTSIVILRGLPVLQCRQCGDTELENRTMLRVDELLGGIDTSTELEVIRYAA
jgi:YgiT-type zinc finger domain-containing protein